MISLEEVSKVVERISVVFTSRSLDLSCTIDLPSTEDFRVVKAEFNNCIMTIVLKYNELCCLFEKSDNDFNACDESALCTFLGLGKDNGKWPSEIHIQMLRHYVEQYYIERAIENKKAADRIQSKFLGEICLMKQLRDLGFNKETAVTISLNIPDDLIDLQKSYFWALRYLAHALTYPIFVSFPRLPRYPEHAETLDSWFNASLPSSSSDSASTHVVKMINISSNKSKGNALVRVFLEEGANGINHKFLYHSTNHTSAMSIVRKGIKLDKGRENNDFSSKDGFYLSEKFEHATSWRSTAQGRPAIIVYIINDALLDASQGLDLTHNQEKWKRVVCHFRLQKNDTELQQELVGIKFIRGPMCTNGKNFKGGYLKGFGRDDTIQICIRDKDYARDFGSLQNIACVIFF